MTRSREQLDGSPDPSLFREPSATQSPAASIALDDVLWARIRRLPEEARRVLEIVAVSGQPLELESISRCAELVHDERVSLSLLRSARLIRSTARIGTDEIETYHDRIRETVVARLEPEVTREHHRRLALALEASGSADPEVLGVHLLGSGQPERAADYFARAADQAAEALAFDRAAALYRRAQRLAREHEPFGNDAPAQCPAGRRAGQRRPRRPSGGGLSRRRARRHRRRCDRASAPLRHAVPDQRPHRPGPRHTSDRSARDRNVRCRKRPGMRCSLCSCSGPACESAGTVSASAIPARSHRPI